MADFTWRRVASLVEEAGQYGGLCLEMFENPSSYQTFGNPARQSQHGLAGWYPGRVQGDTMTALHAHRTCS